MRGLELQGDAKEDLKKSKVSLAQSGWLYPVKNISLDKLDNDDDVLNFMSLDMPELRLVKRLSCFEQICD